MVMGLRRSVLKRRAGDPGKLTSLFSTKSLHSGFGRRMISLRERPIIGAFACIRQMPGSIHPILLFEECSNLWARLSV